MAKKKETQEGANRIQRAFGVPTEDDWDQHTKAFDSREDFDNVSYWRTGLIPIDLLTKGKGIPKGRLLHMWCENGIGKTTIFYDIIKGILQQGYKGIWLPFEPSDTLAFDMGLVGDTSPFYKTKQFRYISDARYYSDLDDHTRRFVASDYDLCVVDSLTSVAASPEVIKDIGLEKAKIGIQARIESEYLRNVQAWTADTGKTLLYITQARTHIATQSWDKTRLEAGGGQASKHYSDIRLSMRGARKITTKDLGMSGVETNVGTKGWIFVEKARHSPPEVKIPITVLFGRGVSNLASLREFLEWSGNIVVGGGGYATIIINGSEQRVRGAVEVYDILRVPENYAWAMDYFYSKCEDYFQYWVEQSTYPDKP